MKFRLLVIFLLLFGSISESKASHIIGGEILVTYIGNFEYELTVNIMRDGIGINPPVSVVIDVFRRGTGIGTPFQVDTFNIPMAFDTLVPPPIQGCQLPSIIYRKSVYYDTVTLSPTIYQDPSGYLFTWTSCCRNANISNGGSTQSHSILTLFPPVVDASGNAIINSTPQSFAPISDYACTSRYYKMNFNGVDPDGDSLSYVMYRPFLSNAPGPGVVTSLSTPFANPTSQFGHITWDPTYNEFDAIHGNSGPPDPAVDRLMVNPTSGQLTVTPRIPGMHLFGVWCREFRDINGDGIKELIGSVFRDYQLPIVNGCPIPDTLDGPIFVDPIKNFIGFPGDTAHVPGIVWNRTVPFKIWDSHYDPLDSVGHNAFFSIEAINFDDSLFSFSPSSYTFSSSTDTATLNVTFQDCAASGNIPYELRIATAKGHCPLPFVDSTSWFVLVDSLDSCSPTTGIENVVNKNLNKLTISPNPVKPNGILHINGLQENGPKKIVLRNSNGKIILERQVNVNQEKQGFAMGEFDLNPGIYILSVTGKEEVQFIRFVVTNH